ncbi:futalosine hydrolase [Bacteroidota bacterium]
MKILIVSATLFEVKKLVERFDPAEVTPNRLYQFTEKGLQADLLISGIGILSTAFHLGKLLSVKSYDLAVNAGICGSYNKEIPLGSVLHVTEEQLPEAGVEEEGTVKSLFELGLMTPDEFPFEDGRLINTLIPELKSVDRLKKVTGNTVNTLKTESEKIKNLLTQSPADVESMEGAAFLFACLTQKIPSVQIRAVSNYVGERDKAKWEIRLAVKRLNEVLEEMLDHWMTVAASLRSSQ